MIGEGEAEEDILSEIWAKITSPLEEPNANLSETAKSLGLLVSSGILVIALLLNVIIIFNIICGTKRRVGYFLLLAFLLFSHLVFCLLSSLHSLLPFLLPETDIQALKTLSTFTGPLSRASLGTFFLIVSGMNLERFLAG